ncbi:unnamed protein product [Oikopleura dioica]|uniref:Piwi domain-containing protein n=1 Tax=Oikopleura dioica TaxID=34765 RepID=E4XEH1_OIKDI|nr:unnamed protein product [Oikopleura dioica]
MVAGLHFDPESNHRKINAAFSWDSRARKYLTGHRKVESGRNVVKELFKEGIERCSKRASNGAMPERIIIFCSLTTGAQDEENIFNSKYLKSAICGIYEAYNPKLTIIAVRKSNMGFTPLCEQANSTLQFYICPEHINARPFHCDVQLDESNIDEESLQLLCVLLSDQNNLFA